MVKWFYLMVLVLLTVACASKEVEQVSVNGADVKDITVPPAMGVSTAKPEDAANPDDTVSFREWREEQSKTK